MRCLLLWYCLLLLLLLLPPPSPSLLLLLLTNSKKWSKWHLLPANEDNPSKCKQTHRNDIKKRIDTRSYADFTLVKMSERVNKRARKHVHATTTTLSKANRLIINTALPPVTRCEPKWVSCNIHLHSLKGRRRASQSIFRLLLVFTSLTRVYDILTYSARPVSTNIHVHRIHRAYVSFLKCLLFFIFLSRWAHIVFINFFRSLNLHKYCYHQNGTRERAHKLMARLVTVTRQTNQQQTEWVVCVYVYVCVWV